MSQSRRNFLKTAGLAAVGTGLLAGSPFSSVFAQTSKKKSGLGSGKMKMTFKQYDLTLRHVFTIANYSRTTTPCVLVEIEYDGVTGYGEASLPPYLGETPESVMAFLRKVDLEQFKGPFELDDILTYVDNITANNTAAKASVDIALHDLVGKLIGAPWYQMWGLNKEKALSTTYTIGIDTDEVVKQKTREAADKFNILKVKLGRDTDKQMITAIRSVTDKPIAVDANQGWKNKHHALEMISWLHERGIVMIEQPMPKWNLDDTAWLLERSPLPIYADESFQRLPDVLKFKDVFSGVNIKLMKCTGMREAHKIVTVARALNMDVMIGCMTETSCAISAATQLSLGLDFADLDGALLISNDCFKGATLVDGKMTLPDTPGIGVTKIS